MGETEELLNRVADLECEVEIRAAENRELRAELEQSKVEKWRRSLEKMQKDNCNLRAQLARCIHIASELSSELKACAYIEATSDNKYIVDELDCLVGAHKKAKADAEVLRCAEILYEDHSMAAFGVCNCDFCKAVRTAREAKCQR